MATNASTPQGQRSTAQEALAALGQQRSDHRVLSVTCSHSHHLASVYDTPGGLLLETHTGPHAHGRKDLPDQGHKGAPRSAEYAAWLRRGQEQTALPAWCDCGPRELTAGPLLDAVDASQGRLSLP